MKKILNTENLKIIKLNLNQYKSIMSPAPSKI